MPGGRPKGSVNKATKEGREYARQVLLQDENANDEWDEEHIENPVLRQLRTQAREGVGTQQGLLPPATFSALADRIWPKMRELVDVDLTKREDLSGLSMAQLAALAADEAKREAKEDK